MVNSGHKPHFIRRILCSGIMKYERMVRNSKLEKSDPDYKPLHHPSGRSKMRLKRKAMARDNWFKGSNTEDDQNRKGYQGD